MSEETREISKRTFNIVLLALFISFMALTFSIVDFFGDKSWRKEQLTVLKEIHKSIDNLKSPTLSK